MKNIAPIKSTKSETPKTPGGISKSLLTPCRRVGLSRNWKKGGPSPFVSPLTGTGSDPSTSTVEDKLKTKSRKRKVESEKVEENRCTPSSLISNDDAFIDNKDIVIPEATTGKNQNISNTPTRHVEVPRKKKSKTLLSALSKNVQEKLSPCDKKLTENIDSSEEVKQNTENSVAPIQKTMSKSKKAVAPKITKNKSKENLEIETNLILDKKEDTKMAMEQVQNVTPVKCIKSIDKNILSPKGSSEDIVGHTKNEGIKLKDSEYCTDKAVLSTEDSEKQPKHKSPTELTKECIVVIQKKIFKIDKKKHNVIPQVLGDSDSDDMPLGHLNKNSNEKQEVNREKTVEKTLKSPKVQQVINLVDEEEDFIENRVKIKKLEDKSTSISGLKKKPKNKPKTQIQKPSQQTQNTDFDEEDDDFDFDNKKTILIRKTYEKAINPPQRAKSTGSITQKDIDELRARIEAKKKILLARAVTADTEELRSLIKKWQKGCQDALMELMDLMKTKFPDKQNMAYSEMLSVLKIPANLVGYDDENDCFTTPDDTSIVLSKFNNL